MNYIIYQRWLLQPTDQPCNIDWTCKREALSPSRSLNKYKTQLYRTNRHERGEICARQRCRVTHRITMYAQRDTNWLQLYHTTRPVQCEVPRLGCAKSHPCVERGHATRGLCIFGPECCEEDEAIFSCDTRDDGSGRGKNADEQRWPQRIRSTHARGSSWRPCRRRSRGSGGRRSRGGARTPCPATCKRFVTNSDNFLFDTTWGVISSIKSKKSKKQSTYPVVDYWLEGVFQLLEDPVAL